MPQPINIPSATAVKTVTVNGGNLFRLALDNLGDALQWTRLASANRLIDPFLPPNVPFSLIVPPINSSFIDTGILQPNGGPIFAVGGGDVLSFSPLNTILPSIAGIIQVGQPLVATTGTWATSQLSFTYQWLRNGTAIADAQNSTYVVASDDIGSTLSVSVTAAGQRGIGVAISEATNRVIDVPPTILMAASISGTPTVGMPFTATDAIWNHSVNSKTYQWQSNGVPATGMGAATLIYIPAVADIGHTLTITVTAMNSGGNSAPSTSANSAVVTASTGGLLDFSQTADSSLLTVICA